ncbi:hypothetical protein BDN72DRAFT_838491 [Pluteus cervinus]|uniref:Uncharacterized protein n=1 Tax=Pluteus cervinus TaxID=181527 RepID=A0ACD3AYX6_9AGAR|nr:hypothetical protein BDN72DRAFT_838491 [Pluteus cervinus]
MPVFPIDAVPSGGSTLSQLDPQTALQLQQLLLQNQLEASGAGRGGRPVLSPLGPGGSTLGGASAPSSGLPRPGRQDSQAYPLPPRRIKRYAAANPYEIPTLFESPTPDSTKDAEAQSPEQAFSTSSVSAPGKPRAPEVKKAKLTWKTLPVQLYLHTLLRLPDMYWNRLDRIFRDADDEAASSSTPSLLGLGDLTALSASVSMGGAGLGGESEEDFTHSPRFASAWESFVESLIKEWETLNVVAALLLSAIFTIFQIDRAANDNLTVTFAILSFACALMGLLYGCMYIIRFGSLKRVVEARHWVEKMQREDDHIHRHFWNEWILLAMPAVWLCWSILLFIACILCFVWRANLSQSSDGLTFDLGAQISVSILVGLGVIYFFAIVWTFRTGWEKSPRLKEE